MLFFESIASDLNDDGMEGKVNHLLEELGLVTMPEVGYGLHVESFAAELVKKVHVFDSEFLIGGEDGAGGDGVYLGEFILE